MAGHTGQFQTTHMLWVFLQPVIDFSQLWLVFLKNGFKMILFKEQQTR